MVQVATANVDAPIGHQKAESASPVCKVNIPAMDVNAILFRAVNECTSNEDTRYYLQGVYVQPHPEKGVLLTATDGHRLMCAHDESGSIDKAAIVHVDVRAFAGVKINPKKPDEVPRLKLDSEGHVIVGTYRSLELSIIDGSYPDYPRVLTPIVKSLQKGVFAPASFRHEYLAAFSKISDMLGLKGKAIRFISTSEADAALILFSGVSHAFGVLMPMRTDFENGMPAFMRPILDPLMQPKPEPAPALATPPSKPKRAVKKKKPAKPSAKKKSRRKGK